MNNSSVALACNNTPENPPDCVSVTPSTNSVGIVGEPVNMTLSTKLGTLNPDDAVPCTNSTKLPSPALSCNTLKLPTRSDSALGDVTSIDSSGSISNLTESD